MRIALKLKFTWINSHTGSWNLFSVQMVCPGGCSHRDCSAVSGSSALSMPGSVSLQTTAEFLYKPRQRYQECGDQHRKVEAPSWGRAMRRVLNVDTAKQNSNSLNSTIWSLVRCDLLQITSFLRALLPHHCMGRGGSDNLMTKIIFSVKSCANSKWSSYPSPFSLPPFLDWHCV